MKTGMAKQATATQMTMRALVVTSVLMVSAFEPARASVVLQATPAPRIPASAASAGATARRVPVDTEVARLLDLLQTSRRREAELYMQLAKLQSETTRSDKTAEQGRYVWLKLREASMDLLRAQGQLLALCDGGPRPDGWLGVSFQGQNVMYRKPDGSTTVRFVQYPSVGDVADNSPASAAGIRRGDTVMVIGELDLRGNEIGFSSILRPGASLPLKVRREGELKMFNVRVTRRPGDWGAECAGVDQQLSLAVRTPLAMAMPGEMGMMTRMMPARAPRAVPPSPPGAPVAPVLADAPEAAEAMALMVSPRSAMSSGSFFTFETANFFAGAELRRLNADLADLTGVEDGVFVMNVLRGSPAEAAGLRSGDVIVRANDSPVVRPDQLARALRERDDRTITLTVMRKQKKQTVTIKAMPE